MQKNTCIVFIHSINEFHLSKNYATQTLCSRSIIQSYTQIAADKLGVSRSLLRFWFNGGTMRISLYNKIKGNLAHYNSHSALYRPSNTPANISASLLEILNRVANSRHPFTASITPEIIFSAVLRFSM